MEDQKKKLPYPKAVGFIVTNEFCERFSYYGMRAILSLYLRKKLLYSVDMATIIFHLFSMFAYFFPLLGAIIADGYIGRFKTILYLSMVYAAGCVMISLGAMPPLNLPHKEITIFSLLLIALGTGGIKPCVSAFGGDQFILPEQERYLACFFSFFYFAINAGSLLSTFLTPILRADVKCFGENNCYSLAFGVPGILMVTSLLVFFAGKNMYIIKKPAGNIIGRVSSCIGYAAVRSCKSKEKKHHWLDHAADKYDADLIEDIKRLLQVLFLYIPLPLFWALFDQQGSRWTFQADRMRQDIGPWTLKPDQMQVLNPLLILGFIPLFEWVIYPTLARLNVVKKPLHKMICGGLLAALAFVISGILELQLVPTYGTQLSSGLSQLRVFNGYNCTFTLNTSYDIPPLGVYENLEIPTIGHLDMPYSIQGKEPCSDMVFQGVFHLHEKLADSYYIGRDGVETFKDNNAKAIDGVYVRFLANVDSSSVNNITIIDKKKEIQLEIAASNKTQQFITDGVADVYLGNEAILKDYKFEAGAVYTINVNEDGGKFTARVVTITPPNSIHILWLVPQYVVITMGEVMFSVTGLEFSYTQAPLSMKSVMTSAWLLTVAFGNLIVALIVEGHFLDAQWKEFFMFAGLMFLDMIIFTAMAWRYKYVEYLTPSKEQLRLAAKASQPEQNLSEPENSQQEPQKETQKEPQKEPPKE